MKKTFITLLALGGLAVAEPADLLVTTFTVNGTTAGDWTGACDTEVYPYLTTSDWQLVRTADGTALGSMANSGGQLRPNHNVGSNEQGWTLAFKVTNTSDATLTLNEVVFDCFTFTSGNGYQGGGATRGFDLTLTYGEDSLSTGDFTINGAGNPHPTDGHGVVKFELADGYTLGAGQQLVLSLAANRSSTEAQGCFLGINDIKVKGTPEPATATLSLLALAGLAVRRRRH